MLKSAVFRALHMAVLFLAGLLLANLSMPAQFGRISLMVVNAAITCLITGLGTDAILMHFMANGKWTYSHAFSFMLRALFFQLILFLLLECAWLGIWGHTLLAGLPIRKVPLEFGYFLGLVLSEKYGTLFYSCHRSVLVNRLLLGASLLYMAVLLLLPHFLSLNYQALLWLISGQSFFQGLLLFAVFHLKVGGFSIARMEWREVGNAFRLSALVMVTNIIQFFAYRVDFWLIEHYHSSFDVGLFVQANKLAGLLWVVPNIFALLLIPKLGQIGSRFFPHILKLAGISNFLIACAMLVLSWLLYTYVLAPQYALGMGALLLMTPGYFCWALVLYLAAYYSWAGKFFYNFWCSCFCLAAVFFTDVLLIPKYSIKGAALANTLAYSATLIIYLILYRKGEARKSFGTGFFTLGKKDFYVIQKALK